MRILLEIKAGQDEGLIAKDVPVYYLSPSSRELTKEYINHPEWFDSDCVAGARDLFKADVEIAEPRKRYVMRKVE